MLIPYFPFGFVITINIIFENSCSFIQLWFFNSILIQSIMLIQFSPYLSVFCIYNKKVVNINSNVLLILETTPLTLFTVLWIGVWPTGHKFKFMTTILSKEFLQVALIVFKLYRYLNITANFPQNSPNSGPHMVWTHLPCSTLR